ncbi:DUF6587 family protein [Marilutibacter spongiae]|uniref:Uncharacterized protein n=1 Tax=Marilutibacter spongiae TaxID=2025720 RepID=A0A7W3TLG3_9GAMM|nr:DUF6587 family protein [Lysobacter spongiae]MBB1060520.1 hypothetical protein [Lysobacter spongiae]
MDASLFAQYVAIALAVLASAVHVLNRQLPGPMRRLRVACAVPLLRAGRPAWAARLGRWIAPTPAAGKTACGGCDGCGPGETATRQH